MCGLMSSWAARTESGVKGRDEVFFDIARVGAGSEGCRETCWWGRDAVICVGDGVMMVGKT